MQLDGLSFSSDVTQASLQACSQPLAHSVPEIGMIFDANETVAEEIERAVGIVGQLLARLAETGFDEQGHSLLFQEGALTVDCQQVRALRTGGGGCLGFRIVDREAD